MAGRGPAPSKDRSQRVRPGKGVPETTTVASDEQLRGPALPDDAIPEPWHPRTQAWWDTWRRSPQAQTFTETDWDFLLDTALMHHTMWLKGRWEFASELRLRAAKFGATPEDRARLRMQIAPSPEPAKPESKPSGRYGHLRSVESA
jgi:hypothetical protein